MTVINPTSLPSSVVTVTAGTAPQLDQATVEVDQNQLYYDQASGRIKGKAASSGLLPDWNALQGLTGVAYDPYLSEAAGQSGTGSLGGGYLFLGKIYIAVAETLTKVVYEVVGAGVSLTANENFIGIFNPAGTLIGLTGDLSTPWASTGVQSQTLTVQGGQSLAVTPGSWVQAGLICNHTNTGVSLRGSGGANTGLTDFNFALPTLRWCRSTANGLTAIPATRPSAGNTTQATQRPWFGVI